MALCASPSQPICLAWATLTPVHGYTLHACKRAQNQFDSIDLSDNAIVKIEGFPRLLRLKQLLLNNNRISRIAKQLEGVHTLHATGLLALQVGSAR